MAGVSTQGQRHDRIRDIPENGKLESSAAPNLAPRPPQVDVSIAQKMLSAVSGSILTSLLGMTIFVDKRASAVC